MLLALVCMVDAMELLGWFGGMLMFFALAHTCSMFGNIGAFTSERWVEPHVKYIISCCTSKQKPFKIDRGSTFAIVCPWRTEM